MIKRNTMNLNTYYEGSVIVVGLETVQVHERQILQGDL